MQSSSYGVDSSKGAANVSNPYDFKNVQVCIINNKYIFTFLFIIMIILNLNLISISYKFFLSIFQSFCNI
jgi:hypothetical protein